MIQMMKTISPMPTTNFPKLNTNFSIDWIVKSEKNKNAVEKTVPKSTTPTNIESLPKDYDQELSTALRLVPPKLDEFDARKHTQSSSPKNESLQFYEDYRGVTAPTEPHLLRPMPFLATPNSDPKFNYFEKSPMQQQHQQQPQQPSPQHPLTPPNNNGMPIDAMQQHSQILSAQIQMAAALNYQRHASGHPQALNFSQIFSNNFHRTSYQLQPWLLHRHSRFPYGFSGDFLLHPYRKPKRIRTAFAPLQLLELENAFEGNQYVVGSERKALAKTLNLTETQVKVWFQNRRTKHKRMQQEGGSHNNRSLSDDESNTNNYMDDEQIDIEDTDDYDDN